MSEATRAKIALFVITLAVMAAAAAWGGEPSRTPGRPSQAGASSPLAKTGTNPIIVIDAIPEGGTKILMTVSSISPSTASEPAVVSMVGVAPVFVRGDLDRKSLPESGAISPLFPIGPELVPTKSPLTAVRVPLRNAGGDPETVALRIWEDADAIGSTAEPLRISLMTLPPFFSGLADFHLGQPIPVETTGATSVKQAARIPNPLGPRQDYLDGVATPDGGQFPSFDLWLRTQAAVDRTPRP